MTTSTTSPTKFYVWFTKNDLEGKWPRISNESDFNSLPKDVIRSATELESKNINTVW